MLPSITKLGEFFRDAAQFNLDCRLNIGSKGVICALLSDARTSGAPIKDGTIWWGSELFRKIGSSSKFENMDTETNKYFHIQVVVFVNSKVLSWTQILSQSNIANFQKSFVYLCTWYRKSLACQMEFLGFQIRSSERYYFIVHCM